MDARASDRNGLDRIADVWGRRTPYIEDWPARQDSEIEAEAHEWVQSACLLCSVGCGIEIGVRDGRIVGVRGRSDDHVNRGRLGPKGLFGWKANASQDRLRRPLLRKRGVLQEVSWNEAMTALVDRTHEVVERHGAGAIGFYDSGQLFLEEYYTLAIVGDGGIGTPHMDGSTRLCTATAAAALVESFGSDGNPGCFADFDTTEAIFHVGHNPAHTQTVLWSRILDRRRGPRPPKLVVVDPRGTPTAKEADVHLAPRPATNLALLNGLLNLVLTHGRVDREFVERHTVGFDGLAAVVARWTPEAVRKVTGVPERDLMAAAEILGQSASLVSTVLQGVYQSHQATASAIQVNNLHLVRGLIGKPGCTVFQMNGQPTAQNTRECGADGEMVAFLNHANPDHVKRLAEHWRVEPIKLPHRTPPTHCMQIFRYAEQGSVRLLWIMGTNPSVSLPFLSRIDGILEQDRLFVVVSDAFMTETARRANLVLPTALWGEKTGTFTNPERRVHLSFKAVDPPGEARSDLDILLDFARRMKLRDRDGNDLIKWDGPEGAFDHFKVLTKGQACDYSGLSYAKLAARSGIQWPCNEQHPDGAPRLYADSRFRTAASECESYGHDLETAAALTAEKYRALELEGKAHIKSADYEPPKEAPDREYPLWLTTGRLVHHWHTRTKTGRSPELNAAAPEVFVDLHPKDAARHRVREGDLVEVASRRGRMEARARLNGEQEGLLFVPFHYGDWDEPGRPSAANLLTVNDWDPISKQPHFKFAAVRVRSLGRAKEL